METIPPPEVRLVNSPRVACDGDEGALGHPRIWLQIGANGYADCGYCDRRFVLAGGPAESQRMPDETGPDGQMAPGATQLTEQSMSTG